MERNNKKTDRRQVGKVGVENRKGLQICDGRDVRLFKY